MRKRQLKIKAIGKIVDKEFKKIPKLNDRCFGVDWIKGPGDNLTPISMERKYLRYNIYSCTLFRNTMKKSLIE